MNKKTLLVTTTLVIAVMMLGLYVRNINKAPSVLGLNIENGVQITAPIKFEADENVIALEFKISGQIVKIECLSKGMQTVVSEKDGCVMVNLDGGVKTAIVANVTFIDSKDNKPVVSGVFRNPDAKEIKNAKLTIEY